MKVGLEKLDTHEGVTVKALLDSGVVTPEIQILLNQDIREVFTSFLHYDIILAFSYQVPGVI